MPIKIAQLNVRSLVRHFTEVAYFINQEEIDVFCLTETWLTDGVDSDSLHIPGYKFYRADRRGNRRGGGAAVYVSNRHNFLITPIDSCSNTAYADSLWLKLKTNKRTLAVGVVYRPDGNITNFIDSLDDTLSSIIPVVDDVILTGDMNIDLFKLNNPLSKCLKSYSFTQVIDEATRITATSETLIDPIFVSDSALVLSHGTLDADLVADHRLVFCTIGYDSIKRSQKIVTVRDFKRFNHDKFSSDLLSMRWQDVIFLPDIEDKVKYITDLIKCLFDTHAPLRTMRVSKPKAPWLTDVIKLMMKTRDNALAKYKITKNDADWAAYRYLRNFTLYAVRREKKAYFKSLFSNADLKKCWRSLGSLGVTTKKVYEIPNELKNAGEINNYFAQVFNQSVIDCSGTVTFYEKNRHSSNKLFSFSLVSTHDVAKIIDSIRSNAVGTDSVSISMIKLCLPHILPYITHIINCCLEEGYFPQAWKSAIVKPVPKVNNPTSYSDLRPISLLPTLSKILEKAVQKQLYEFVNSNGIVPQGQSGFRESHSTTSALLSVTDGILSALDNKQISALVLLDFSKAFDTVIHKVALAKLKFIGCEDNVLNFFSSYLVGRTQAVCVDGAFSGETSVTSGVPQGSVLGPLLFIIYISDLFHKPRTCTMQGYADDTQVLHSFSPECDRRACDDINMDLSIIYEYSAAHNLKLNSSKTFVMLFGNPARIDAIKQSFRLYLGGDLLPVADSCKNLGLVIDCQLKYVSHVNSLLKKAYMRLKLLYGNRHALDYNLRKYLCETLVLSLFNYADIVYRPCLDSVTKRRIQVAQNACCRFVFGLRKYDHVSNYLKVLQWLPMDTIWVFHLLSFVFVLLRSGQPAYLRNKLSYRTTMHTLSLRDQGFLNIPRHSTSKYRDSFSYASVSYYNRLPQELKLSPSLSIFKFKLKKYFLEQCFNH